MANIHSQKKRILRTERERLENRRYTSAIKTHFRRLETLVAGRRRRGRRCDAPRSRQRRSTRPSSAARCTATTARARSPAPPAPAPQRRLAPPPSSRPTANRGKDARSDRDAASRRLSAGCDLLDRAQGERVLTQCRQRRALGGDHRAAARVQLQVGQRRECGAQAAGVAAHDVGDEALGGARGHAQRCA